LKERKNKLITQLEKMCG